MDLVAADYERSIALIAQSADMDLGFVDASMVAVAERLGLPTIATLNRRDFSVVRPRHIKAFELVP